MRSPARHSPLRETQPPQRDTAPSERHSPLRETQPPQRDTAPSERHSPLRETQPPQRDTAPSERHSPLRETQPPQRDTAPSDIGLSHLDSPCPHLFLSSLDNHSFMQRPGHPSLGWVKPVSDGKKYGWMGKK